MESYYIDFFSQNEMKFYIIISVPTNKEGGGDGQTSDFLFLFYSSLINFCIPTDRNTSLCAHSFRRIH